MFCRQYLTVVALLVARAYGQAWLRCGTTLEIVMSNFLPPSGLLSFSDSDRSPLSIRARALVFVDPRSRQLHEQVEVLAEGVQPLLIHAESGTGKELLARHIHRQAHALDCLWRSTVAP